jgi:hypothetical protein
MGLQLGSVWALLVWAERACRPSAAVVQEQEL